MAVAPQLPNFAEWLRENTQDTVFVWYQRVPRNMITDKPLFDAHMKHLKKDAEHNARIQGIVVTDWTVEILKPETLQVGDREEMFPPHAKYTNVIYLFGRNNPVAPFAVGDRVRIETDQYVELVGVEGYLAELHPDGTTGLVQVTKDAGSGVWCPLSNLSKMDWEPLEEGDVSGHAMFQAVDPHEDGRRCAWHMRLSSFVFDGSKKCLRTDHTAANGIRAPWGS